jgi:hypothetical protein
MYTTHYMLLCSISVPLHFHLTPTGYTTVWKEGKVVPMLSYLSTKPRRHGGNGGTAQSFLTLVLVEGEWSASPPGRFNHPILIRWVGLSGQHGRQKILDLSRTHYTPALCSAYMWTTTDMSNNNNNNSVVLVRERTIPTEWPQLVSDVSANFWG